MGVIVVGDKGYIAQMCVVNRMAGDFLEETCLHDQGQNIALPA